MSRLPGRIATVIRACAMWPLRRPPREVRRILVAHWLLLGDTLLLAPLLAKLAGRYPGAELWVLARPGVAPLFSGRPYGARVIAYDPRDFGSVRRIIGAGGFDLAYVLGDNRYAWLARAAGARWIVGFAADRPAWKNWMLDEQHGFPEHARAWADFAADLVDGASPRPYRIGDWPAPAAMLELPETPYAVLHVGASSPLKLWPTERWRALAEWLQARGLQIVWSAGRDEAQWLADIDPPPEQRRHCGDLSLPQLWRLLAGAQLLVCPDTGIAHMGRTVGVPTVALFGPGSFVLHGAGVYWAESAYRAVTRDPFPCRDQRILFRRRIDWVRRCGRSTSECASPACMHAIALQEVCAAIDDLDRSGGVFAGARPAAILNCPSKG